MTTTHHAEHLGSPLRPQWLLGLVKNHGSAGSSSTRWQRAPSPWRPLALSPQCGFASGSAGSLITVDDERRKLELVASTLPGSEDNRSNSPEITNVNSN